MQKCIHSLNLSKSEKFSMIENFLPKKNDKVPIYGNLEFWKKRVSPTTCISQFCPILWASTEIVNIGKVLKSTEDALGVTRGIHILTVVNSPNPRVVSMIKVH